MQERKSCTLCQIGCDECEPPAESSGCLVAHASIRLLPASVRANTRQHVHTCKISIRGGKSRCWILMLFGWIKIKRNKNTGRRSSDETPHQSVEVKLVKQMQSPVWPHRAEVAGSIPMAFLFGFFLHHHLIVRDFRNLKTSSRSLFHRRLTAIFSGS